MNALNASWWKRASDWIKRQYEIPVTTAAADASVSSRAFELIPGQLSAVVHRHELSTLKGAIPCWTYVTNGLQRHQQCEIVFTLVRGLDDTAVPMEPLQLFPTIYEAAREGRLVHAGGVTQFGQRKFLGRHLAYIPAQHIWNVDFPPNAICAILVTEDEVTAVQEFGTSRVMARLGQAASFYPCPQWSDPARAGISFATTRQRSLLAKVPRLRIAGCRVYQSERRVVLLFAKGSGGYIASQFAELPPETSFALLAEVDPDADGCFVWQPGQSEPAAIVPEGSTLQRVCGCFLLFLFGQAEDGVLGLEDGFGLILTSPSWEALQEAIIHEKSLTIPPTGARMGLVLDWTSDVFENPVDGKSYVSPGGWRICQARSPAAESQVHLKVTVDHIRLLTGPDDVFANTTVEGLGQFCQEVQRQAAMFLDQTATAFELLVQFECTPSSHEVQFSHKGEADRRLLRDLYDALTKLEKLKVDRDHVAFQIKFKVAP